MVPEPGFSDIRQIEGDVSQLLNVVPPIEVAYEVAVLEPVIDIITPQPSEDGWVTMAVVDGHKG